MPLKLRYGYFAPVGLQVGYQLNRRSVLELGIGYGSNKIHDSWVNNDAGQYTEFNFRARTHAIAIPVKGKFIVFNAYKRLSIYATAIILPAYGNTRHNLTETTQNVTNTIYSVTDNGINVFGLAALGFNYKIKINFLAMPNYYCLKRILLLPIQSFMIGGERTN